MWVAQVSGSHFPDWLSRVFKVWWQETSLKDIAPLEAMDARPPQQPFLSNLRGTASAATEYGRSGPPGRFGYTLPWQIGALPVIHLKQPNF